MMRSFQGFRMLFLPLISGGIWTDAFGTIDRLAEVFHGVFALLLYVTHLSWVVVIVRQCVIHVGHVEIVPIRNSLWFFTAFFDEGVHLTDADSAATDVGLAHEIVCNPPRLSLRHTYTFYYSRKNILQIRIASYLL